MYDQLTLSPDHKMFQHSLPIGHIRRRESWSGKRWQHWSRVVEISYSGELNKYIHDTDTLVDPCPDLWHLCLGNRSHWGKQGTIKHSVCCWGTTSQADTKGHDSWGVCLRVLGDQERRLWENYWWNNWRDSQDQLHLLKYCVRGWFCIC